jgi:hypothetical protein
MSTKKYRVAIVATAESSKDLQGIHSQLIEMLKSEPELAFISFETFEVEELDYKHKKIEDILK